MKVQNQVMIGCRDVAASAQWYCNLLEAQQGHGGDEYEQILKDGQLILQLHKWDVEDHHGALVEPDKSIGNGVVLWFEVEDFEQAVQRGARIGAQVDIAPMFNPLARQMEVWLRDPDGYKVVIAGPSEYPRAPLVEEG